MSTIEAPVLFSIPPVRPDHRTKREGYRSQQYSAVSKAACSTSSLEQQIVQLGRNGQTELALDVFYNIPFTPTIRQVNAAIDACARARPVRMKTALEILQKYCRTTANTRTALDTQRNTRSMKTIPLGTMQPNVYTFGALMNAISNAGDAQLALKLVTTTMIEDYGVYPNAIVYNAAISACAKSTPPRPDIAIELLELAYHRNVALTVNGYNAACSAAAKAANLPLAAKILQRMILAASSSSMIPSPDAVTYGTVMSACEKCFEWKQCLSYFEQMVNDAKLRPDRLSLTSALHACQQLGLPDQAQKYLKILKLQSCENENQQQSSDSKQGPDGVCYRLTISACARAGAWREAIAILDDYIADPTQLQPEKDVMAYTAAIHGCENAGEWQQAFILLDQMRRNGAEPNSVTFAAVIGACATASAKLVNGAWTTTERSSTIATSPTLLARPGIHNSSTMDSVPLPQRKALQLLNVLRKGPESMKPNILVYNAAIRVCAESFDLKRAFKLYDLLKNEDELEPSIVTYGTLMKACERVGSIKGMDNVFLLMRKDTSIRPNEIIYGAALSSCRKAGEGERAYTLLRTMIHDGLQPNIATFNTALSAQIEDKDRSGSGRTMDRCVAIFQLMQSKELRDVAPNRQSYNLLVRALNQAKQPQNAEAYLRQMKQEGFKPDVDLFTATVAAYERNGQPLRALRLMESMREDGYDFYESSVLNDLFKKAVRLANAVGRTWTNDEVAIPTMSRLLLADSEECGNEARISFAAKDLEARLRNDILT